MTRIDFYTGSEDKLRTACLLCHLAMKQRQRVLLHVPDAASAERLDQLLWHFPRTAFLPHCASTAPEAANTPICISHDDTLPHADLLISLHDDCLPFFSRYDRLAEIVGSDPQDVQRGRARYKFYRDRGYELHHHPPGTYPQE